MKNWDGFGLFSNLQMLWLGSTTLDGLLSEDEWSMLNSFRIIIQLQSDQHAMIEEAIHAMAEVDSQGQRRIERLQRFNIVCPFNN